MDVVVLGARPDEIRGVLKGKIDKVVAKALTRKSAGAFPKLTTLIDGKRVLKERPPLVVRIADGTELDDVRPGCEAYRNELRPDLRLLLGRYELVDFARKVVGVGSVGMPTYVGLCVSADGDPLFLQVKAAVDSVLEPHVSSANPYRSRDA